MWTVIWEIAQKSGTMTSGSAYDSSETVWLGSAKEWKMRASQKSSWEEREA